MMERETEGLEHVGNEDANKALEDMDEKGKKKGKGDKKGKNGDGKDDGGKKK